MEFHMIQWIKNIKIKNEIFKAIYQKNTINLKKLLDTKIDLNFSNGSSFPLLSACLTYNIKAVKLLLDNGANVDFKNIDGKTALNYICWISHRGTEFPVEIANELIANGADVNTIDKYWNTPLINACSNDIKITKTDEKSLCEIIISLLKNGADIECKDINQHTPLIKASVIGRNINFVKILLSYGANPNAFIIEKMQTLPTSPVYENYLTAWHLASRGHSCDKPEIVKYLSQNGCSLNPKDIPGWMNDDRHSDIPARIDKEYYNIKFSKEKKYTRKGLLHTSKYNITDRIYVSDSEEDALEFIENYYFKFLKQKNDVYTFVKVETKNNLYSTNCTGLIYDKNNKFIKKISCNVDYSNNKQVLKMIDKLKYNLTKHSSEISINTYDDRDQKLWCLKVIIECESLDFYLRRMAIWWAAQFRDDDFLKFLKLRFLVQSNRHILAKKNLDYTDEEIKEKMHDEEGLRNAVSDILSNNSNI